MLRLFTSNNANPAECVVHAREAADGGKVGKARRLFEQAIASDPTRLDTVVRCTTQTPSLALHKTFIKKALNDPHMHAQPARCRNLAWDLAFAGQALQTRTDYTPYFNRLNLPLNPREVLAPFAPEAPGYLDIAPTAMGCLVALRVGFLGRHCREIQREGYRYDEDTLGAEQAALHHVLGDILGDDEQARTVVRGLAPGVQQRAVAAAVRWGDTEGLVHLLNANARFNSTEQLAHLLLEVPETRKRMQWLHLDSRLSEAERRQFVYGQNITCLRILLDHGLNVEVVAAAMLERSTLDRKILELLLTRGLDANFIHPVTGATLGQRALYSRNEEVVRLLKQYGVRTEVITAAVLNDWHSIN